MAISKLSISRNNGSSIILTPAENNWQLKYYTILPNLKSFIKINNRQRELPLFNTVSNLNNVYNFKHMQSCYVEL